MRVLHFYKTSLPDTRGGVEQVIHQLARGGCAFGIETDVLSLTTQKNAHSFDMDGYHSHRAYSNFQIASTGFSVSALFQFMKLAKQADIIHYHFPWPFMDMVHFLARVRKPTVVTYHSDIIRQKKLLRLYRPLQHRFLSSVDRIVATSPNYMATSPVLNAYLDKVRVIPIGLDKESYPNSSNACLYHWRNQLGETFFLFIGVLRYYKGLHILIEAASKVSYPIVIVGAGPIEQALKKQVDKLGLRNIIFLGVLSDEDKIALLQLCFAIIFPSQLRSEAFGVSLLEGAMFGKPMISCEIGTGTTFINSDGETGLVVPPDDPNALASAMQFLKNHPEKAVHMGKAAELRYWEYFTAGQMMTKYVSLYSELLT